MKKLSSFRKPKRPTQDRLDIIEAIHEKTHIRMDTIRVVINALFGRERFNDRGVLRDMVESGGKVEIDNFGTIFLQESKQKTTLDVNGNGKLFTPARCNIKFEPCTRWYWDVFFETMKLPDEPLPPDTHFSVKLEQSKIVQEWKSRFARS